MNRNAGCHENLLRDLAEVEVKRKAALNELILKREAFRKQHTKWQQRLPAGWSSSNSLGRRLQPVQHRQLAETDGGARVGAVSHVERLPRLSKRLSLPTLTAIPKDGCVGNSELSICDTSCRFQTRARQREPLRELDPLSGAAIQVKETAESTPVGDSGEPADKTAAVNFQVRSRRRSLARVENVEPRVSLAPKLHQRRSTLHNLYQAFNGLDENSLITDLKYRNRFKLQLAPLKHRRSIAELEVTERERLAMLDNNWRNTFMSSKEKSSLPCISRRKDDNSWFDFPLGKWSRSGNYILYTGGFGECCSF